MKKMISSASMILLAFAGLTGCGKAINLPPYILGLTATPSNIHVNQFSQIFCNAKDPDDGDNTLVYVFSGTGGILSQIGGNKALFSSSVPGQYIVTCTVYDPEGASDNESVIIGVSR